MEIRDACGGIEELDPKSVSQSNVKWVHLKLWPTNLGKIPRILSHNDGESSLLKIILEEDLDESGEEWDSTKKT